MRKGGFYTSVLFVIVAGFQNCAPAFHHLEQQGKSIQGSLQVSEKMGCKFVGPGVLQDRIINKLGIAAGDFPTLTSSGAENKSVMRLDSNLGALGKGNPVQGTFDDFSCGTVKFKAAMEVMVDACALALSNTGQRQKIFPRGPRDFDELYTRFIGRVPTKEEYQDLLELIDAVPFEKQEAAACAAVASSLESLIVI